MKRSSALDRMVHLRLDFLEALCNAASSRRETQA